MIQHRIKEREPQYMDMKEIITEDMTPYEKEKAVYDWMAKELSYDTGALQAVSYTHLTLPTIA